MPEHKRAERKRARSLLAEEAPSKARSRQGARIGESLLLTLQRSAGNSAAASVVERDLVVQRYRRPATTNFGEADTASLKESRFRSRRKQPWISQVDVVFTSVVVDGGGVSFPKGTATATYFANPLAMPSFSVVVTGGPTGMPSDPGSFRVWRIEGVGYNDPSAAADIAAVDGPGALMGRRRGRHRRYTRPKSGELPAEVPASMHLAVFYNRGEALHNGGLDVPSHGCVHIDDWDKLLQLNYHSVKGKTKVNVSYSGLAKAVFFP